MIWPVILKTTRRRGLKQQKSWNVKYVKICQLGPKYYYSVAISFLVANNVSLSGCQTMMHALYVVLEVHALWLLMGLTHYTGFFPISQPLNEL